MKTVQLHRLADGAGRTVLLCGKVSDPDPQATAQRSIRLLAAPDGADVAGVAAALDELRTGAIGVAAWSGGARLALALSMRRPDLVSRLVLMAAPMPDEPVDLAEVCAKTLLLNGSADRHTGPKQGVWYQRRLPNARYEQVPGADHDLVRRVWPRVLSHLAPRNARF